MKRTLLLLFVLTVVTAGGCRTVSPVRELHTASAPDISRITLKNGTIIAFNEDFGWYDKQAGIIEGVTTEGQHVEYHVQEITKVETVRSYSIIVAALAALAPLGLGIYLMSRLLALL